MPSSRSSGVDVRGTWTPATAAAAATSDVISAVPCTALAVLAANSSVDTYYLMLFDLAVVPGVGTAPRIPSIPIETNETVHVPLGRLVCAVGLCWGASLTVDTYTPVPGLPILQVSAELV